MNLSIFLYLPAIHVCVGVMCKIKFVVNVLTFLFFQGDRMWRAKSARSLHSDNCFRRLDPAAHSLSYNLVAFELKIIIKYYFLLHTIHTEKKINIFVFASNVLAKNDCFSKYLLLLLLKVLNPISS
jgi:hypothetical protein